MESVLPGFWRRSNVAVNWLAAAILPVVAAMAVGGLVYKGTWEQAHEDVDANAALVAQFVDQTIQEHLRLHEAVRQRAAAGPSQLRSWAFHEFLVVAEETTRVSDGIALIRFNGDVVASSRTFPVNANMGERDYLASIEAGSDLFIDRLLLQPSNRDAVVVVSPLRIEGFGGVIASSLNAVPMEDFLAGIAPGERLANVVRGDGKLLVLSGRSAPITLPADAPFFSHKEAAPANYTAVAAVDGVERLFSLYPTRVPSLYVGYGLPVSEIRAAALRTAAPYWAMLALIGLATGVAIKLMRDRVADRVQTFAAERRRDAAEKLAAQREQLVAETHHRVKNNLALVASLVRSQRRKGAVDAGEIEARIQAIAELHNLMYSSGTPDGLDFGAALERIASSAAIVPQESGIALHCTTERGILLGPDQTTPLALVVAELVTNAVKHAFSGREPGRIDVAFRREGENAVLEVADNGVGMTAAPAARSGMQIVEALAGQLGGKLGRVAQPGGGTCFRLTFPIVPLHLSNEAAA